MQSVVIDCFPSSAHRYKDRYAIVAIDVIRATTTAVTAVATGHRCFPADSLASAFHIAGTLRNALLVGELGGKMPEGFDLTNSPAELDRHHDTTRPVVLLSSSGTQLIIAAAGSQAVYLACLRNYAALSRYLVRRHSRIAVIGAGSRNEFREEDQMCCAMVAEELIKSGYEPENHETVDAVNRWHGALPSACSNGRSAAYLRSSGQTDDLEFIMSHINDLDAVFALQCAEIVMLAPDSRPLSMAVIEKTKGSSRRYAVAPTAA